MSRAPRSTTEVLDLALDLNTGELTIGNVRVKPSGAGCDDEAVSRDDGNAVFEMLRRLRDEVYEWRNYAERYDDWMKRAPGRPHSR